MRNQTSRRGALGFWLGLILASVSAPIWLIFIVIIAVEPSARTLDVVFITLIPIILTGLGIYCVKRGRKSVSARYVEWESEKDKKNAGSALGVALIAIGTWAAILLLPAILSSFLLFALIGGPGILISHKLKRVRLVLSVGLGVAAWGYLFVATTYYRVFNSAILFDSLKTVVPVAVLGTLAFALLGRKKLSTNGKTLSAFLKLAPFTLLIATPFIIGGLQDYNSRCDMSPAQVINLKIVDKWIDYEEIGDRDIEIYVVRGETLDGSRWFSFYVGYDFYDEHDIGSLCWIRVRCGALGYEWLEGYGG